MAQNIHCLKTQLLWRLFWKCYLIGARTNLYALLFLHFPSMPTFSNSSTFIAVEWKTSHQFAEQANRLQTEVLEGLQHLSFSGVDLARLLFEKLALLQYYRL